MRFQDKYGADPELLPDILSDDNICIHILYILFGEVV